MCAAIQRLLKNCLWSQCSISFCESCKEPFPSLFYINPFSSLSLPNKQSKLSSARCTPQANQWQADTHAQLVILLLITVAWWVTVLEHFSSESGPVSPCLAAPCPTHYLWDVVSRHLQSWSSLFVGRIWKSSEIEAKGDFLPSSEPDLFFTLTSYTQGKAKW